VCLYYFFNPIQQGVNSARMDFGRLYLSFKASYSPHHFRVLLFILFSFWSVYRFSEGWKNQEIQDGRSNMDDMTSLARVADPKETLLDVLSVL